MKKLKALSLTLLIGVIMVSCKPSTEDARKYNDDLIAIEKKLTEKENAYLDIAFSDSSNEQKKAVYTALANQANEAIAAANKMEAFDKSTEYLDAGKAYFAAIKGLCDAEYKQVLDLVCVEGALTEEQDAQLETVTKAIDDKSAAALKKIQDAQMVFAAKYKMQIEETSTEAK